MSRITNHTSLTAPKAIINRVNRMAEMSLKASACTGTMVYDADLGTCTIRSDQKQMPGACVWALR